MNEIVFYNAAAGIDEGIYQQNCNFPSSIAVVIGRDSRSIAATVTVFAVSA